MEQLLPRTRMNWRAPGVAVCPPQDELPKSQFLLPPQRCARTSHHRVTSAVVENCIGPCVSQEEPRQVNSQSLPILRLPAVGPLTRMAMLYDFSPDASAPPTIDWEAEERVLVDQRLASVAQRVIHDLELLPPDHVARQLQDAVFAWTQASCIASKKATDDLMALYDARI